MRAAGAFCLSPILAGRLCYCRARESGWWLSSPRLPGGPFPLREEVGWGWSSWERQGAQPNGGAGLPSRGGRKKGRRRPVSGAGDLLDG